MTSCTGIARGGFWVFWKKKSVSWELDTEREGWLSLAREALWWVLHVMGGGDGKVIRERLCISLPNVETFNSKVIKGFVPELRNRYVLFGFRDSYVLCMYVMNILCTFHICVSWVWYNVRYPGSFSKWTRELKQMDQRIRKFVTMHPRDDEYRLCQEKKEEDVPKFKIALMHQYNKKKIIWKARK